MKAPPSLFFPQKKSTFALPIGKLGRRGSIKKAVSKRKKRQKCFLLFLAAFSFVFLLKNVYTILKKKKKNDEEKPNCDCTITLERNYWNNGVEKTTRSYDVW